MKELNKTLIKKCKADLDKVKAEVAKVVVGQEQVIDALLKALLANGHVLLEGIPGIAKTLVIRAIAGAAGCKFKRIQFTPDLLPTDIVGITSYEENKGFFVVIGPIFANFVLADEINRAPPKVQSALLESMQEKQVTIGGTTFKLDRPFLVMATQNPIDQEGTYPLPEAQVDRFMLKVHVGYTSKEDEMEVMRRMSNMAFETEVETLLSKEDIFAIRDEINNVNVSESLEHYIIELVFASRDPAQYQLKEEAHYIQFGASPRASINLNLGAKAIAFLDDRDFVLPEDVKAIADDVMNHRIILNYEAEADGINSHDIIKSILNKVQISK